MMEGFFVYIHIITKYTKENNIKSSKLKPLFSLVSILIILIAIPVSAQQSTYIDYHLSSNDTSSSDILALLRRAGISPINLEIPIDNPTEGTYQWHTFYGPAGFEENTPGITHDVGGGIYIVATSLNTWNGPDGQPPLNTFSGSRDITVLKLSASGAYQWHTFYGSSSADIGRGIAVDGIGGIYIVGYSLYTWNGSSGQLPLHPHNEDSENFDITVLKLNTSGVYQWHTFYGGGNSPGWSGYDFGTGIALSNIGEIYIAGSSQTPWDGPTGQQPLHEFSGGIDITLLKLNADGAYLWHTFYGSPYQDNSLGSFSITIDGLGGVYMTGQDYYSWNGPDGEPPLYDPSGNGGIFVLKLNSVGGYQWHTFYGSGLTDISRGIAIDGNEGVYITGSSAYSWDGPEGQPPIHLHSESYDAIVLKLNAEGAYQWHTFYGTSGSDSGQGVAVDSEGGMYINGSSDNSWNGPLDELPLHAYSGETDIYILKLDALGSYQWHTFYGSTMYDWGVALAVDNFGGIYSLGISDSSWNGPEGQLPLHEFSGNYDIAILKLKPTFNYDYSIYLPLTLR
jgi:hypothetical protein